MQIVGCSLSMLEICICIAILVFEDCSVARGMTTTGRSVSSCAHPFPLYFVIL